VWEGEKGIRRGEIESVCARLCRGERGIQRGEVERGRQRMEVESECVRVW
jgi:hypothetical protein